MSSQLFNDNFKSSFENFQNIPGQVIGDTSKRITSFSALNQGVLNNYNSVFSNLIPKNKNGFIVKNGTTFNQDLTPIDPYFVGNNTNTFKKCQDVCSKQKFCKAFTFNKKEKKCNTYNQFPKQFIGNIDNDSAYKTNLNFNFDKLNTNQQKNIQKRIGAQYLMKRFNVISNNIENFQNLKIEAFANNNITNCLSLKESDYTFPLEIIINSQSSKNFNSNTIKGIYLINNGIKVSDIYRIPKNTENLIKNNIISINNNFIVKNSVFNGLAIQTNNNDFSINQLILSIRPIKDISINNNITIVLYNEYFSSPIKIQKNDTHLFYLKNKESININNIKFKNTNLMIGSNFTNEQKKMNVMASDVDSVFRRDSWSMEFQIKINKNEFLKNNRWTNLLFYGNNNRQRSPGIWFWPNNYNRIHFRFRTTNWWNDGFDINLPNITDQWINIKIEYQKYNQRISGLFKKTTPKYRLIAYVNGKKAQTLDKNGYFQPWMGQNFYTKYTMNGAYNKQGFEIQNILLTANYDTPLVLEKKKLDLNKKILGYTADAQCIYNKVPETEDIYNRTLEENVGQENNSVIIDSIINQNNMKDKINNYEMELNNVKNNPSNTLLLFNNAKKINNLASDDSTVSDIYNKNALLQKVGSNRNIESFTNKVKKNNIICYIVIIIIMLIVLAFIIQ